ncbi:MAG: hypothetical protein HY304_05325 [candidate division Zixibacteria bacterium]|nr:hypothetical protein [candidate division Zixibacteria bacterium]
MISAGTVVAIALLAGMGCSSSPNGPGGGNAKFTPTDAQINVGDTVNWVAVSGSHTITSGTGSSDPSVGHVFDHQLPAGQSFSHVFAAAGVVPYFCRIHETMGMNGSVTVSPVVPKTVAVSASGMAFSPVDVGIHVGDTVKWTASGTHTVTSGTGSTDPAIGALFDHHLTSGQSFTFVFLSAGTVHYFCRIHEGSGMKGTVTVTASKPKTVQVNAAS